MAHFGVLVNVQAKGRDMCIVVVKVTLPTFHITRPISIQYNVIIPSATTAWQILATLAIAMRSWKNDVVYFLNDHAPLCHI